MPFENQSEKTWPRSAKLALVVAAALPAALVLSWCASRAPRWVEQYYARGLFPAIGGNLSRLTGLFPFSCAEVIVLLGAVALVVSGCRLAGRLRQRGGRKRVLTLATLRLAAVCAIIYAGFLFLWGLNYRRLSFAEIARFDTENIPVELIDELCEELIGRTNELRAEVQVDSDGVTRLRADIADALERAGIGFGHAASLYEELGGTYGRAKPVFFSAALSYLGVQGIYFPFTAEANVNTTVPAPALPFTISHEMAHQRGFAREDEANYIAYLTCRLHPDVDFRYSGYLTATLHTLNAVADPRRRVLLQETLSTAVKRDLEALHRWRERYDSPFAHLANRINHAYLKAQGQSEGVRSYGRMVELIVGEWRAGREDEDSL